MTPTCISTLHEYCHASCDFRINFQSSILFSKLKTAVTLKWCLYMYIRYIEKFVNVNKECFSVISNNVEVLKYLVYGSVKQSFEKNRSNNYVF